MKAKPVFTGANNSTKVNDQLSTPPINIVFLIWCSHASNTRTKLSFAMIQANFYSQSEATFLNTKPRLIFFLVLTCKFYSQSEATLLNTKLRLILYLVFMCETTFQRCSQSLVFYSQSKATFLNTKPRLIFYLVHVFTCKSKLLKCGAS